ncbi:hypothetical protein Tco_0678491 [Tanacetum coccineum]|uniref:Uncharacterized protein n=1 Tax=Tanacetum coccineum TaxID=301880 RepID=A0ABQ4XGJ2_9ASTR
MKVWLSEEVGSEDDFAQDMSEHCYAVKLDMEKRARLMVELEKLAVSEGAAHYLDILRCRQDKDAEKLRLLRDLLRHARDEAHERQLALDTVLIFGGYVIAESLQVWPWGLSKPFALYCVTVKMDIQKRCRVMVELKKFAVAEGGAAYLKTLRQRQKMDEEKLSFWKSAHLAVFFLSLGVYVASCTLFLADRDGSSSFVASVLLADGSSNISVKGEVADSATGSASNGVAVGFRTSSNVNLGFPSVAFLLKWYLKIYLWPSACLSAGGTRSVSLPSAELTMVLQSGTKVCASRLKHVIVVVAVPSSTTTLKQYMGVVLMLLQSIAV